MLVSNASVDDPRVRRTNNTLLELPAIPFTVFRQLDRDAPRTVKRVPDPAK